MNGIVKHSASVMIIGFCVLVAYATQGVAWKPRPSEFPGEVDPLRIAGQFHRIGGVVRCSGPMHAAPPPLRLVSKRQFAERVYHGQPLADLGMAVQVAPVSDCEWSFHVEDLEPGSYCLFCDWPGFTRFRLDEVLLQDDFPLDNLEVQLDLPRCLELVDDVGLASQAAYVRYSGFWFDGWQPVRVDDGRLVIEERVPDGFPAAIRIETDSGAREAVLALSETSADACGPFLLSSVMGDLGEVRRDVRVTVEGYGLPFLPAPEKSENSSEYQFQSARRGAGLHLLFPCGGAAYVFTDLLGNGAVTGPACQAILAVGEQELMGDIQFAAVPPDARAQPLNRLQTFKAGPWPTTLVVLGVRFAIGGDEEPKFTAHAPGGNVVGSLRQGCGAASGLQGDGPPTHISIDPGKAYALPFRVPVTDSVTREWDISAQCKLRVHYCTADAPAGVIVYPDPPPGHIERLVLWQCRDELRVLERVWSVAEGAPSTRILNVPEGDYVVQLHYSDSKRILQCKTQWLPDSSSHKALRPAEWEPTPGALKGD